jgi:hypothetical protein
MIDVHEKHSLPALAVVAALVVICAPRLARCDDAKVVPVGPDTYELTMAPHKPVDTDFERVLDRASRQAANYCARMKRTVVIRDSSINAEAPTRLRFSCVPKD